MSTNFPTSADTTNVPGALLSSNPHSTLHINDRDAIIAIEAKLGTGASNQSASSAALLVGTGSSTTEWQTAPSGLSFTTPTIVTSLDMNGTELILDADADTSITADTDDQIDIKINSADDFRFTPNTFTALSGSTIATDTIAETTAGNGVTIDSLSIKDGKLNTNASVIPNNLIASTGTTWVWQTWAPTWVNLTAGNGTTVAKYIQNGKTVTFKLLFTFGSTSAMGTSPTFTLPATATSDVTGDDTLGIFQGQILDSGTTRFILIGAVQSTTTGSINVYNASGTYGQFTGFTSTVPMTWTTGDKFYVTGSYEAA